MSFTDAISRVSAIQQQITALTTPTAQSDPASSTQFASALAQAQASTSLTTGTSADLATGTSADLATGTSSALPVAASAQLTSGQRQFAATLVADTGLNPSVVSAWLLAEENGGAATSRQAADNNDWLNVGYTGTGTAGAGDAVWSDPVSAANATAGWLKGEDAIPGYGTASAGVRSILATVGQSPSAQISALQSSGWAASGYPELPSLYAEVSA
jgi:hypothetical protein